VSSITSGINEINGILEDK